MEDHAKFIREVNLRHSGVHDSNDMSGNAADPAIIYDLFCEVQDPEREKLVSIAVNANMDIINFDVIAIGPINAVTATPKDLFRSSVAFAAPGVVVTHNHASGDPTPNDDDQRFHERILKTYRDLGIDFHDHIIIGDGRYYSFSAGKEFQC